MNQVRTHTKQGGWCARKQAGAWISTLSWSLLLHLISFSNPAAVLTSLLLPPFTCVHPCSLGPVIYTPSAFYFSMVRATDGSHWGWQQETGKAWLHLTSTNLSPWAKMSSLRTCMSNSALEGDAVKYFGVVASLRGKVWSHFRDPDLFIKVRDLSDYCRGQKWKDEPE